MKRIFRNTAFYIFLIPVFFVLHGYAKNFGFISIHDCLPLLFTYESAVLVLFFIFLFFYKDHIKAAQLSAYIICFYLFFGAIYDFLKRCHIPLYKFNILIPVFLIGLIFGLVYLKKKEKPFSKSTLFLNSLFIIYFVVDISSVFWKVSHPDPNRISAYITPGNKTYTACKDCAKPDIYLLLFDEYSSSSSLKKTFHYNNSDFDSFLVNRGFHIQTHSYSNYSFTSFSMASILNMSYLQGIKNPSACTIEDFEYCDNLVRDDKVIKYLAWQGYDIENYSVFELAGDPSKIESTFLPVKTNLITAGTFWSYLQRKNTRMLYEWESKIKEPGEETMFKQSGNNQFLVDLVKEESIRKAEKPKFVYAHFYLPHPPFFYDKNGNRRDAKTVFELNAMKTPQGYFDYIPYTNKKAEELINTIQKNTNNSAVIIFLGDHGFRYTIDPDNFSNYFQNQNAVYFPDKEYSSFSDSISTVNEFRVIFNKLFNAGFPLLKDSTILLKDKQ